MGMTTNIPRDQLHHQLIYRVYLKDCRASAHNAAYGESALPIRVVMFAVEKDPRTYEHIPPETVGKSAAYSNSDQAGRANICPGFPRWVWLWMQRIPVSRVLVDRVKENVNFAVMPGDGAEASFEILARRAILAGFRNIFGYCILRFPMNIGIMPKELVTESEAIVNVPW